MKRRVFLVGPQPPPVHGLAAMNATVLERLRTVGANPVVIDLSAKSLGSSWHTRAGRLPRVLIGLVRFALSPAAGGGILYLSVSGGPGQVYEILFLLLARLRGMRRFLHHHSYAYVDRLLPLTRILTAVAGHAATHIVLSKGMATGLQRHYPSVRSILVISNAALLPDSDVARAPRIRSRVGTIAFLGNISVEKGIFDVLDVADSLHARGHRVDVHLAGPFVDAPTERAVRERLERSPGVSYLGPRYGPEKVTFFEQIDVLLFPTRYANEAEPVTIHEALMSGVPVIAFGRGAIGELIAGEAGAVVDPGEDFTGAAVARIEQWLGTPEAMRTASEAARNRFLAIRGEATQRWTALLAELFGEAAGQGGPGEKESDRMPRETHGGGHAFPGATPGNRASGDG